MRGGGSLFGLLHDVMVIRAERLPVRPIPEQAFVAVVALDVVDDQVHTPWVALQLACHRQVTRVQQANLFTSTTELVVRLSEEVGALALPAAGLVPLAARLPITLAIILAFALLAGRRTTETEGLRLACHTL